MTERNVFVAFRQDLIEVGNELARPVSVLVECDVQLEGRDDRSKIFFRIENWVLRTGHQDEQVDLQENKKVKF